MYSRAVVLDREDIGEADGKVHLFTQEYGKVSARARSVRKIISKLSAHLQPLRMIRVRFMELGGDTPGYWIIDSMLDDTDFNAGAHEQGELLVLARFLSMHLGEFQPDDAIWEFLENLLASPQLSPAEGTRRILSLLGLDPSGALCSVCREQVPVGFHFRREVFLCEGCSFKLGGNQVLYFHTPLPGDPGARHA